MLANFFAQTYMQWIGGILALAASAHFFRPLHARFKQQRSALKKSTSNSIRLKEDIWQKTSSLNSKKQPKTWSGTRKFRITKAIKANGASTLYLHSYDGKPLSSYLPGQHLSFVLNIPGQLKPVTRCYSLSDSPDKEYYRVTVKQVLATDSNPAGLVSNFFYEHLQTNDIVNVKAPAGNFYLQPEESTPVVLISGGVGITPMISMLNTICESGSDRQVWFFYGTRNRKDQLINKQLHPLAQANKNIHLRICYSEREENDVKGIHYHHDERVTVDLLKRELPSKNFEYYICGPNAMLDQMTSGLENWGVPKEDIHFEAFGPAQARAAMPSNITAEQSTKRITFAQTRKEIEWSPEMGSLLDLAEANGIDIDSCCRNGSCGTCEIKIQSGDVTYLTPPSADIDNGSCLSCIAIPLNDLTIEA